ncbi:MAG: helix-turn-helix domain containing protein [Thermodesulfobacteriaceae bacterium]|nr:helix-turn-helix domain containing protein [Thermodesulfobacteriaceae bacterium]
MLSKKLLERLKLLVNKNTKSLPLLHKFRVFLEGKKGVKIENQLFSFSLTPSPIKDLKMLQRVEVIKDASQRKEVAFRLKVIKFHNSFGKKATGKAFGICKATIYRWKKLFLYPNRGHQRGNAQRGGHRR